MRTLPRRLVLPVSLVALYALSYAFVAAQAQPERVLVIEGATLIDGNGGAPLPDSMVVIRGNRIAAVSRRGQAPYPPNAHVMNAAGRFIMPGLFDSQVSYEWYLAEPLLNYGVTSTIDVGTSGETAIPYRDAVFHQRLRGPRTFTSISRLVAEPEGQVMTDAGLTPMQIIQGTTKWPAEMIGKQDILGTITASASRRSTRYHGSWQ